jgi:hypothetical protein
VFFSKFYKNEAENSSKFSLIWRVPTGIIGGLLHILSESQGLSEERKGTKRLNEYHRKRWVQGEKVYNVRI